MTSEAQTKKILEDELEALKSKYPRVSNQFECFDWICNEFREPIAVAYHACTDDEMPVITVFPYHNGDGSVSLVEFGTAKKENVKVFSGAGDLFTKYADNLLCLGKTPVFCQWAWSEEAIEIEGDEFHRQPISHLGEIPRPFTWGAKKQKPAAKKVVVLEKTLEQSLLAWLNSHGVKADNQITAGRHRMDLWIPGECFLELKKGKVSGDDVCQAIDYCAARQKPVILVGDHISSMASRGAEAFNKAVKGEMIIFITWSGIKTYLKGLLSL